jgi:hypothetical protein
MPQPTDFKRGDKVIITCNGEQYAGQIVIASKNQVSLAVAFDAIIDGHLGMMPLLLQEGGVYISIVTGVEVSVRHWSVTH